MAKLDLQQNSMLVQNRPPVLITSSFPLCGYGCPFFPQHCHTYGISLSTWYQLLDIEKIPSSIIIYHTPFLCSQQQSQVCIEDVTM